MDIRAAFLEYFREKGHKIVESAPLVPDDPTLLFTNAGMVPFKRIFTGEIPAPTPPRAASSQTCIRAGGKHNDLENVGYTNRHHTFFEMLGNFSFGDYFKEEAIAYAWEFVTEVLELPEEKLWVTVHTSDDEAEEIWKKHISADRIMRFGDKDNFWQMGDTGPCGPCSEIFYDQGAEHFHSEEDVMGGEGDRFLEIWNLVFMQYERDEKGELHPLPKPSIDTGMGLERVTAIKEGKFSNYDTHLFMPLIEKVSELTGRKYVYEEGASFRVIADHIRAVTFLLAQGVNFDREGRGYVLRRILRRAVRHGYLLGLRKPFMYRLVDTLNMIMGSQYPYLLEKAENVKELMRLEEERFFSTIESGLSLFEKELARTKDIFSGEVAFKLYDTYGFPLDLTEDMLREKGLRVDSARFEALMREQRERAKAAWKGSGDEAASGDFKALLERFGPNRFVGYETTETKTKILALLDANFKEVSELPAGSEGWVFLEETPFYAESGGQRGDEGILAGKAKVVDTKKFFDLNLSKVVTESELKMGEEVEAVVDESRTEIARHHSATHLLHAALREVLGEHVTQAGSLVEADRLRFDFSHPRALSSEEIAKIEDTVNEMVLRDLPAKTEILSIDEAKAKGAMALFGEKYGEEVRVVSIGDASIELCGGTHVKNSSEIGLFFITKESGVSAGVRRIEGVCSRSALKIAKSWRKDLSEIAEEVKNRDPMSGVKRLKEEIKALKSEIASLQSSQKKELRFERIGDIEVAVEEIDAGDIKQIIDEIKNQKERVAVMLFQRKGEKVMMAAGAKNVPIKAGDWIRQIAPIVGGGGGGRDDFAQAGGKDASRLAAAKEAALDYAKKVLG
ncbi:MAG: alanine--tRNA ligase [Campylobacteraceae bacterium 4484_4]|nr:MAG: alanine--tRNA ligase [Campylobacteraceae bacterium 4484_4]